MGNLPVNLQKNNIQVSLSGVDCEKKHDINMATYWQLYYEYILL